MGLKSFIGDIAGLTLAILVIVIPIFILVLLVTGILRLTYLSRGETPDDKFTEIGGWIGVGIWGLIIITGFFAIGVSIYKKRIK